RAALLVRKIETELCELERYVRLESVLVDRVEGMQVDVAGRGGVLQAAHAFAQVVERDRDALGVDLTGDGDGLVERLARDEPAGQTMSHRRGFHPFSELLLAREEEEESAHTRSVASC